MSGSPGTEDGEDEEMEKGEELSTKKPAMVALPDDMTAMQIDCGTFHTGTCILILTVYYSLEYSVDASIYSMAV